ncbi:MAG TPA: S8 family serine peptidase [Leptolyngbyaceae cyanobacterium]
MLSNSRPSSFSLSTTSTEFTPLDLHIGALPSFGSSSELTGSLERGSKLFRSSSIAVPTVSPDPGNTLETAYNIGTLSDTHTFTDAVSSSNTNDFYRFSLDSTSNFNLSLTGLSSDADVRLIQDVNSNGIVDDGDEIVRSARGGSNDESINHSLAAGTYFAQVYQYSGDTSYTLSLSVDNPSFTSFSVFDASSDNTSSTVFEDGAIRFSYNFADTACLSDVSLEVLSGGSVVSTLGTWTGSSLSDTLINLADFSNLTGGDYQLRAVAHTNDGQDFFSDSQPLTVLSWDDSYGTFAADTLNYSGGLDTSAVILGRGGTDTLDLFGVSQSDVTSINGLSLSSFDPLSGSTTNQAIFGGTAFDYLTLSDGREIYFQGIENLSFSDGSTLELAVHPDDTFFDGQWNLHVSDIPSAWRFTQGASDVLLASLDLGILTAAGARGDIVDISTGRLITDPSDDDNEDEDSIYYGHGHKAISVMASTANNDSGVAGINWNSAVYVNDVYSGVDLQQAITGTIEYARDNNLRVVFQGGIQGEGWLTSGGTQAQLEQLIEDNSDIAMFAVAAGNGGIDIDDATTNPVLSGGVARLQTTYDNVMSVGALRNTGTEEVDGLTNASSVNIARYSNRGESLTLMAATDSPAMNKFGDMNIFTGTSAANPNMAGIASLVWSVNSELTGGELRQILIDTAMDLGTVGDDNTFGNGLVNADAAIRRASALADNFDVANLYSGDSLFV